MMTTWHCGRPPPPPPGLDQGLDRTLRPQRAVNYDELLLLCMVCKVSDPRQGDSSVWQMLKCTKCLNTCHTRCDPAFRKGAIYQHCMSKDCRQYMNDVMPWSFVKRVCKGTPHARPLPHFALPPSPHVRLNAYDWQCLECRPSYLPK